MNWCCENGIKVFDFTGGDEDYKKIWTNDSFKLSEVTIPLSLKGKLFLIFNRFYYFQVIFCHYLPSLLKV